MPHKLENDCQVLIVGGGPVGLFLACCLQDRHISCKVLEQRSAPGAHSRSIGIHPVALELFAQLGIAEQFIKVGHRIENGHAYLNKAYAGTIDFSRCPPPFRYILALPQNRTETLLEHHLETIDSTALLREFSVTACLEDETGICVGYQASNGCEGRLRADFLVGCDGINSTIRSTLGIEFTGAVYPDRYIMGDFSDTAGDPRDAMIYLHQDGLVESFPLPHERRRWVVKTSQTTPEDAVATIVRRVRARTDVDLSSCENFMTSTFGVQHRIAKQFVKGRSALIGDAAHIISPIGGQGMNLGWLEAWALAEALERSLGNEVYQEEFKCYASNARRWAVKARRRAEFNMALGRKTNSPRLRRLIIHALLTPPLGATMAKLFTMRGLPAWPI